MSESFKVTFLGTGGSCAFNNGRRQLKGTNTPCVVLRNKTDTLIFDAGSGICGFDVSSEFKSNKLHLFLSHYHIDHIQGLLFWKAIFDPQKKINIYGQKSESGDVRTALDKFLKQPYQPAGLKDALARLTFSEIEAGNKILLDGGTTVQVIELHHPGGCLGFRAEYNSKSICYMTDIELAEHKNDKDLQKFARDTDLLILDTCYENEKCIPGWGHSSPEQCAKLAKQVRAKQLALFHYNHLYTDEDINRLEKSAIDIFANSFAPADGFAISV